VFEGWPEARHVKMVVLQESRDYWLLCGLQGTTRLSN